MKNLIVFLIIVLYFSSSISIAANEEFKIIINKDNEVTELSQDEILMIYLGKKTLWISGKRIQPAMLSPGDSLTVKFIGKALHKTVAQYRTYWTRRLFSGGGVAPKLFRTREETLEFVAKNPGAIAVVDSSVSEQVVKVVVVVD